MKIQKSQHDEYYDCYDKYVKKYGINTIVLMQFGNFYEIYSSKKRGPNIHRYGKVFNISFKLKQNDTFMWGFPTYVLENWTDIIIKANYSYIVIDQVNNPITKKINRIVTGEYTPGTYICKDYKYNEHSANNFTVLNIKFNTKGIIIAIASYNMITNKGILYENYSESIDIYKLLDNIQNILDSYPAKEYIINFNNIKNIKYINNLDLESIIKYLGIDNSIITYIENINIPREEQVKLLAETFNLPVDYKIFGIIDCHIEHEAVQALCIFIKRIKEQQPILLKNLKIAEKIILDKYLYYGNKPLEQLDIINNNKLSLFTIIDNTGSSMGKRFLRNQISQPITDINSLNNRYKHIELALNECEYNYKILNKVCDISTILKKINNRNVYPVEIIKLYNSLTYIKELKTNNIILFDIINKYIDNINIFIKNNFNIDILDKLSFYNYTDETIDFFNKSNTKINELVKNINNDSNYIITISDILSKLIKNNKNIKPLTIKSNDKDGTYLVTTKNRAGIIKKELEKIKKIKVLDKDFNYFDFVFKPVSNTKTSNIKIFIDSIKNINNNVEFNKKILANITRKYFYELTDKILNFNDEFMNIIKDIEYFDFINSGALIAKKKGYCKPKIKYNEKSYFKAKEMRHPIVEEINETSVYKPHTITLGKKKNGIILYGINGSGKSTLMKSIGINIILAQIGYFVCAKKFTYSPYKSIFTRIRGNDNLYKQHSSFYVEMIELNAIIKRNNMNTLVLADEVCRGTEEKSANIIVASIIYELSNNNASFITATHLHSLIELPTIKKLNNIDIKHIAVDYIDNNLIFSRKLIDGPGDNYYGLKVAKFLLNCNNFNITTSNIEKEYITHIENIKINQKNRYNNMIINKCHICNTKKNLEVHHIEMQKNSNKYYVIDKPHIKKNAKYNTVVLCSKCHDNEHINNNNNNIFINI